MPSYRGQDVRGRARADRRLHQIARPSRGGRRDERPRNYLTEDNSLRSWFFTTDHKRVAMLYFAGITLFFFIGGAAATVIRLELATPQGDLVTSDVYNRLFTIHGVVMVWFFLIPSIPNTLGNFVVPLMIGARDLAFPRLNLASWYLFMLGGCVTLYAVFVGGIDTGWTFYTPFSTMYSNSHVVLAVTGVFIAGFSSILTGLNFIVTIHRLRAPGLTWYRLPLFLWSLYATSVILVLATPVLAMTLLLIALDRFFGIGIFDPAQRRRSAAVPAPVLVLLASGRLHHDPAGHGRGQRADLRFLAQGGVRLQVRRLVGHRHRRGRLLRLGPPHVRQRTIGVRRAGVLVHELHRRGAVGDQGLQLDRDDAQGLDPLRRADALCAGLHRPVHHRRADRAVPRLPRLRRLRHRHLFRRRAFPLHHGRRHGDGLFRRAALLVAEDHRAACIRNTGRAPPRS